MNLKVGLFVLFVLLQLSGCTYLKYAGVQHEYVRIQKATPAQKNLKHLIDHKTYYVVGHTEEAGCNCRHLPMTVAAYANDAASYELVDVMHFASSGTHFGLNLPEGSYDLIVLADFDGDGQFDRGEVIGRHALRVNPNVAPDNVVSDVVIAVGPPEENPKIMPIPVRKSADFRQSVIYPGGALRDLNDPIFDAGMATLGMYDPAAFLEQAPTMFYALDEEKSHKVPVIFVHGIGGSVREFDALVEQLDRSLYKPWFFYYPSGGDLRQLSALFYRIFLSGKVVSTGDMPMAIVAHSMGGLIVREALNRYDSGRDNKVELFVSIATPFSGHPDAAVGVKHGLMVLPAWRDLNPESVFLKDLYRSRLPSGIDYQLVYAFGNPKTIKFGENSDGVVPLSSQLRFEAQFEAKSQFGFDSSHTEVLQSTLMLDYLKERISAVKTVYPDAHLEVISRGGFDLPLEEYSPLLQYSIRNFGHYFAALNRGEIQPFNQSQEDFLALIRKERQPRSSLEREFVRFRKASSELFE